MVPHDEFMAGGLTIVGRARDVATDAAGRARVLGEGEIKVEIDAARRAAAITTTPAVAVDDLRGASVGRGFRARLAELLPSEAAERSPLYLLLDDLPVAALISGYADLYRRDPEVTLEESTPSGRSAAVRVDICAGWASDATMITSIRQGQPFPVPVGPPAPALASADAIGWHEISELAAGAMRRRRRLDVWRADAGALVVNAMFRDTHLSDDGEETVLHEWSVDAAVESSTGIISSCEATPHALPWVECPMAAASAHRLVGIEVTLLRTLVNQELRGTSTCTHLNDLLRSLADVATLATHVPWTNLGSVGAPRGDEY